MKKFLVVIDTQYDFMIPGGALYVGSAEQIITPAIHFLANLKPEDYAGVLFTADTHTRDTYFNMPESKEFPIHCVRDEAGWQNVFNPLLVPRGIRPWSLFKGVFSMWEEDYLELMPIVDGAIQRGAGKPRDAFFENLKIQGIDTIQVFGVASDYCVKWAVDGFVKRGFKVEVIQELCRGIGSPANDVFEGVPGYENVQLV